MAALALVEQPTHAQTTSLSSDNRAFALSYRNDDIIELFADRHDVSRERAEHLFAQLKMWMWAAHVGRVRVCPTHDMDEMWHHFILHTKEYALYCERAFGSFFHHRPTPVRERGRRELADRAKRAARELSAVAASEFGGMIDHELWFDKNANECGYTCEECAGECGITANASSNAESNCCANCEGNGNCAGWPTNKVASDCGSICDHCENDCDGVSASDKKNGECTCENCDTGCAHG